MRHGTRYGYTRHLQAGEAACDECREANNAQSRNHWRRHHPKPNTLAEQIVDVVESHDPVAVTELSALIPTAKPESLRRTVYRLLRVGRLRRTGAAPLTIGRTL